MSFITRCPSCSTTFKVVADQLRVSQGWVRCGHCADVFDANQDIKPWEPTPPVLTNVIDDQVHPSEQASEQQGQDAPTPADLLLNDAVLARAPTDHTPEPDDDGPKEPSWNFSEEERSAAARPANPSTADLPIDVLQADNDELFTAVADAPEPRFVRQAKRQALWAAPSVRVALWVGVLLGVLGLCVQWAIHDRHRLAAWQPALKPLLSAVCQPLGCRIEPVRQLDAVVIDSSALVRLLGQLYALDVVLKNTHAWPVAVPSLELSLTDAQEQVLVRRILSASDWPDSPQVLAPGETWPVKLRLSVTLPAGPPMAGYRIALFYP
jgi:predicted Zn finger-like uncharacterized protein